MRPHHYEKDCFREGPVRIVFLEGGDWYEQRVVPRLAKEISQRLHHTNHMIGIAGDPYVLLERILVWEKCPGDIYSEDYDVIAVVHVEIFDKSAAGHILRVYKLVIWRHPKQNWCICLLVLIAGSHRDHSFDR